MFYSARTFKAVNSITLKIFINDLFTLGLIIMPVTFLDCLPLVLLATGPHFLQSLRRLPVDTSPEEANKHIKRCIGPATKPPQL